MSPLLFTSTPPSFTGRSQEQGLRQKPLAVGSCSLVGMSLQRLEELAGMQYRSVGTSLVAVVVAAQSVAGMIAGQSARLSSGGEQSLLVAAAPVSSVAVVVASSAETATVGTGRWETAAPVLGTVRGRPPFVRMGGCSTPLVVAVSGSSPMSSSLGCQFFGHCTGEDGSPCMVAAP